MIVNSLRGNVLARFSSGSVLYNKRFADKFKDAFVVEPLIADTNSSKTKEKMHGDFGFGFLKNLFNLKISPQINRYFDYASRISSKFETIFLPAWIAIGLIYWPYHWSIKLLTLIPSTILGTRLINKCQAPESPETYIREMIHTHSQTKELFNVDTTTTIDHWIKWDHGFPSKEEFPEFEHKLYRFMNSDTNMATGQYTFGDLESNSTLTVDFKTMPIRRSNRYALGEPTFLYDVKATLNHAGKI